LKLEVGVIVEVLTDGLKEKEVVLMLQKNGW